MVSMATSSDGSNPARRARAAKAADASANGKHATPDDASHPIVDAAVMPGLLDIDGWQQQVYKTAEDHGWVGPDLVRSVGEDLVLMHDEISELFEQWNAHAPVLVQQRSDTSVKPEGLSMEVADLAIRLLALAQTEQVNWSHLVPQARQHLAAHPVDVRPPIDRWHLWVSKICRWWRGNADLQDLVGPTTHSPAWLMALLWADMERQLAAWDGPTLLEAVRIKDAYNQTRAWRHGNKRI
jgi:hypothetical protein